MATFVLWKNLYSKQTGPINLTLQPVLDRVAAASNAVPGWLVQTLHFAGYALLLWLFARLLSTCGRPTATATSVGVAAGISVVFLCLPFVVAPLWFATSATSWVLLAGAAAIAAWQGVLLARGGERFPSTAMEGFGTGLVLALFAMVGMFVLLGISAVFWFLPGLAAGEVGADGVVSGAGLEAPSWLNGYHYAKPAPHVHGPVGGDRQQQHAAVPGRPLQRARRAVRGRRHRRSHRARQRFWNVTWPQLRPPPSSSS